MKSNHKRPSFKEEKECWDEGYDVIGVDEVGRGAFAGPLVVGAVVFSPAFQLNCLCQKILDEVHDSKLLLPKKREELSGYIREHAVAVSIAEVSVDTINRVGIGNANQIGFRKAIAIIQKQLQDKRLFVLVDGFHAKYVHGIGLKNQKAIIKGDQKSISIASASIIAKVHRDGIMSSVNAPYGKYQFAKHKGYGTKLHRDLLRVHGLSPLHRTAFCRNVLS